jgi:hypothetical protein
MGAYFKTRPGQEARNRLLGLGVGSSGSEGASRTARGGTDVLADVNLHFETLTNEKGK